MMWWSLSLYLKKKNKKQNCHCLFKKSVKASRYSQKSIFSLKDFNVSLCRLQKLLGILHLTVHALFLVVSLWDASNSETEFLKIMLIPVNCEGIHKGTMQPPCTAMSFLQVSSSVTEEVVFNLSPSFQMPGV